MVSPNLTHATLRKAAAKPTEKSTKPAILMSRKHKGQYNPADLAQVPIPDFSIKDLLTSIPKHCYQRNAFHSGLYVLQDVVLMSAAFYAATKIDPLVARVNASNSPISSEWLSVHAQQRLLYFALFGLYQFFQGLVFTGIWVNAHECGHQAFSSSKALNNTVGLVLHTFLLVPYHAWRISHARHHAATGHLTRDEVFVPRTRTQRGFLPLREPVGTSVIETDQVDDFLKTPSEKAMATVTTVIEKEAAAAEEEEVPDYKDSDLTWTQWFNETFEDAPAYTLFFLLGQQLFGWQLYLIQNTSGQLHYPKGTNHFNPSSVIFDARHKWQIIASDIGIAVMFCILVAACFLAPNGFWDVARYYLVPYFWCNHWLVMITYLQHTDQQVPHYQPDEWTFARGALATVDREWLWPIGPFFFHGIAETHVAHHVHSKIPHYHAWEATRALKQKLGPCYRHSDQNVFKALWHNLRTCRFVDLSDSILFYRNRRGVPAAAPAKNVREETSDSGVTLSD